MVLFEKVKEIKITYIQTYKYINNMINIVIKSDLILKPLQC